jgi:membrane protein implicated in regulation of membrane protease activity
MDAETARRRAEVVDEVSKWTVGAGIVVVALAPLAIPILVLTGVALLPLLIPAIPLALIAGIVYVPVKIVRGVRRRRKESGRGRPAEEEVLVGVELAPAHHPLVK